MLYQGRETQRPSPGQSAGVLFVYGGTSQSDPPR
uniref:Uncharacterized protein n=1 Tax=Anguilla anguilla TaxID=7936 RepID=A0A0E9QVI5_ANGAN